MSAIKNSDQDSVWASGYAIGVLSQRYWTLHGKVPDRDSVIPRPSTDVPLIVQTLIECMCRAALDQKLYEGNCLEIDRYLTASSPQELRDMLLTVPEATLQ